jgi:NitT/TauT family transport system permease protein
MANTQTPTSPDATSQNTAIAELDSLELGDINKGRDPARIARKAWSATWPKLLAIGLVLGAWQLFYLSNFHGDSDTGLVKGSGAGLANLWDQAQHAQLWQAIGTTVRTAIIGYLLAMLIGSVIGAIVSRIPPLRAATGSIISGLQTMPSIAWFPLAIILFGTSESAILFVMVLGAAPSTANGLITSVDYTPPLLMRAGRTMGLRGISLYRHLILPASLPAYLAGAQARLGVRVAQPDGWPAAGDRGRELVLGHPAEQRPGQPGPDRSDLDHDRDPPDRHRRGRDLQQDRPGGEAPPGAAG